MGLKAFHVVFITFSVLLTVGFGVWGVHDFSQSGSWVHLSLGMGSFAGSVMLVGYGVWFLRKLQNVGYL